MTEQEPKKPETKSEEQELEKVQIKKEELPWERLNMEEEGNLIGKYEKGAEISKKTKEDIDLILRQETDERRTDFAKEWFKENTDRIKEKGYDSKNREESYILRIANEMGAFKELRKNEEYKEKSEEINNVYALRTDLGKERIPEETKFLILNRLNNRVEKLKKAGMTEEQLSGLNKIRKELTEKISGKNLTEEAEEKIEKNEDKENYVRKNGIEKYNELIQSERALENGSVPVLIEYLNYNIEEKRTFFGKGLFIKDEKGEFIKEKLYDKDGKIIKETGKPRNLKDSEELRIFLQNETVKKAKNEAAEMWMLGDELRKDRMSEYIEKEIMSLGKSPEEAEGGIQEVYARAKERLVTEFIETGLKRDKKSSEQLKVIEKDFKGKGENPTEFINSVIERKGSLKELTGKWEKDKENIKEHLAEYGISIEAQKLEELRNRLEKEGRKYESEAKKQRGFLEWLLGLIFLSLTEGSPKEKKSERR